MLNLSCVCIWIAVIDEIVEELHCLPDAFFSHVEGGILRFFCFDEVVSLVGVIEAVELSDLGADVGFVVSELMSFCLLAFFWIAVEDIGFPFVE